MKLTEAQKQAEALKKGESNKEKTVIEGVLQQIPTEAPTSELGNLVVGNIAKVADKQQSEDEQTQTITENNGEKVPKKKKKNRKKKKTTPITDKVEGTQKVETNQKVDYPLVQGIFPEELVAETQTNQIFRCLGGWKEPITIKFPNEKFNGYPPNETHQYKVPRVKNEELMMREILMEDTLMSLRKAAEIQRQVRRFAQRIIRPNRRLIDICEQLENYNRKLAPENGLESGIAFPTGCSLNHVAAHYTPNPGDQTVLRYDDVCKIDFGTHIKGRIIDCAFTVAFNPVYDKLLQAVKDATNTGLRAAGIDVRLGDIGAQIQQTMQSYQVQIKGRNYPVKVVRNLNGHSIECYKIHGGKSVPCVKNTSNVKMQQWEQYAIETFGSTGKGFVRQDMDCSHYMKDFYLPANLKVPGRSKAFYNLITEKFGTLCFAKRWLQKLDAPSYILPLRDLVQNGIVNPYPPLCDVEGSYVAQWEHTFILRPTCKEILSRGEDF